MSLPGERAWVKNVRAAHGEVFIIHGVRRRVNLREVVVDSVALSPGRRSGQLGSTLDSKRQRCKTCRDSRRNSRCLPSRNPASVTQYTESWFHSVDISWSGRGFRANQRCHKARAHRRLSVFCARCLCAPKRPAWLDPLEKRRLVIVLVLVLAVSAIKVSEDALGGESGPIDKAILLFIRGHVPGTLIGFFEAITFTGSFEFYFHSRLARRLRCFA